MELVAGGGWGLVIPHCMCIVWLHYNDELEVIGMIDTDKSLDEQAAEIIALAEDAGVQENYFFVTTFKRYQVQIGILAQLEESLSGDGLLVTKEYVKGRKNLYSNPAVNAYNRTTDSANKTVQTLMRIIREFDGNSSKNKVKDPLLELINGGGEDDEDGE